MLRAIAFCASSHTACCHALRFILSRAVAFRLCVIAFCASSHADQGKWHDADAVGPTALTAGRRQFCTAVDISAPVAAGIHRDTFRTISNS